MANTIIDNITWDTTDTNKSAQALLVALDSLQTDWEQYLTKRKQIISDELVTQADWLTLILTQGDDQTETNALYDWFDPNAQEFTEQLRYIRDSLVSIDAERRVGKSRMVHFSAPDPFLTTGSWQTWYSASITLELDAYMVGHTPLILSPQNLVAGDFEAVALRVTVDGTNIWGANNWMISSQYDITDPNWVPFHWAAPTKLSAGSRSIAVEIKAAAAPAGETDEAPWVGPPGPLLSFSSTTRYNTAISPHVNYLEFIYG